MIFERKQRSVTRRSCDYVEKDCTVCSQKACGIHYNFIEMEA